VTAKAIRHITITGRVQGVGYRAWTADTARARGLHGWVRNRRDGSVEAVIAGDTSSLDSMIAACRQGPSMARVTNVIVRDAAPDELNHASGEGFVTLPTL
jgi:acylphosphatase